MNDLAHAFGRLLDESPITERPQFYVEPPDGRRDWPELARQATLFRTMHMAAPSVHGFAVPNAGKRNPAKARLEGICGGVFDAEWHWAGGHSAWIELKGYAAKGRAGTLSQSQIEWGNRMRRLGHRVVCFFDPMKAVAWLRRLGAPVREVRG